MSTYYLHRESFRFRRVYCTAGGVYNIPALEVMSGHGYGFKAFICSGCGTVLVVDDELLYWEKMDITGLSKDINCALCERALAGSLVPYPEFVFHDGGPVRTEKVTAASEPVASEILDVFTISKR